MTEDKTADLMAFCACEFSGFFAHIGEAIKQFKATGRLPESAFPAPGAAKAEIKSRIKRKPTAFNMFVKMKLEELKASGVKPNDDKNNNELFKLAVAEWTQLSDAQRKQYVEKFKAELGEQDDANMDQLPSTSISVAEPPHTLDQSRADAGNGHKRRGDLHPVQSGNAAPSESAGQNIGERPKKKKKKDKDRKSA